MDEPTDGSWVDCNGSIVSDSEDLREALERYEQKEGPLEILPESEVEEIDFV